MAPSTIAAFWVVALLLIVVPGPDWAFTLGSTLRGQSVAAPVAGLVIGYATLTAVVAAGLGTVVASSDEALTALELCGGGYLLWLGSTSLRRPSMPLTAVETTISSSRGTVLRGIGVSGLNPKALLLFLALLPQFTSKQVRWPLEVQIALLGGIFTMTCGAFYALLGTFAQAVLRARPSAARAASFLSSVSMLAIGLYLVIERLTT